jgi:hypothetical protein
MPADVREWRGGVVEIPIPALPEFADYDLGLSHRTHFQTFNVFAPLVDSASGVDLPSVNATSELSPFEISRYLQEVAAQGRLASIIGPQAYGANQYLPTGYALPYTVRFANPDTADATVGEIRIVTPLDSDLDYPAQLPARGPKIGDINVHVPPAAPFGGEFDFRGEVSILRVSAGIDPIRHGHVAHLRRSIRNRRVIQDRTKACPGRRASNSYTVAPRCCRTTGRRSRRTRAFSSTRSRPPTPFRSIRRSMPERPRQRSQRNSWMAATTIK